MFSHQSKLDKKQNKKARGQLSIDTTCAVQKQVFPYETKIPELKFISFSESQARKAASKLPLGETTPVYPGAEQPVTGLQANVSVRSQRGAIVATPLESEQAVPFHRRLLGRRPEPLKLNSEHKTSGSEVNHAISTQDLNARHGNAAPMIVVTPARDEFCSSQALPVKGGRPASSVYSRYTNCMTTSVAPPVPPLPFTRNAATGLKSRFSTLTATTTFEEDNSPLESPQTSRSIPKSRSGEPTGNDTPGLPTPRRSKGWWNVLSPFSAKSAPQPSPFAASDRTPVLRDAAAMGQSDFPGADTGDEVLRSAPVSMKSHDAGSEPANEKSLRRSLTAPAMLDTAAETFDIYYIASTGLAAPYFDVARRFPSLYVQDSAQEWSPSQSVYQPARYSYATDTGNVDESPAEAAVGEPNEAEGTPARDTPGGHHDPDLESKPPSIQNKAVRASLFSSPSEDELRTPPQPRWKTIRALTQTTNTSMMSPLSATPEVQQAHLGMPVGPDSSFAGQKQIAVSRAPTPTALDEKIVSYSHVERVTTQESPYPASVTRLRPTHTRQDSYGLGISDSNRDLFPPPTYLAEKPRLGTDRYGQLKVQIPQNRIPSRPWYHRHFWLLAFLSGAVLVLLVVMLAVLIPQKHQDEQVQATWLNLTVFPPIAIGVSTVIQPRKTASRDTCTKSSLWTCKAPAEVSSTDLPDFRLIIRSRNGTLPKNETTVMNNKRDAWKEHIYNASSEAPATKDQIYLGRTTDNTSEPYNGEETPFYISLVNPLALETDSKLKKRNSDFSYPYPISTEDTTSTTKTAAAPSQIPPTGLKSNGKPGDPILYPYVTAQPLRLYNRDQDTEHYGFYTYFDRSVYISNPSSSSPGDSSINVTSGVAFEDASAVCSFSQTRMLVQIWTKQGTVADLPAAEATTTGSQIEAKSSSANDMTAPGSFPYPVTFTIDRHGGEAEKKGVYCYALDAQHRVDVNEKFWVAEDRAVGGTLFDAAEIPGVTTQDEILSTRDDDDDDDDDNNDEGQGIDGGSGGCFCQWDSQ